MDKLKKYVFWQWKRWGTQVLLAEYYLKHNPNDLAHRIYVAKLNKKYWEYFKIISDVYYRKRKYS